MNLVSIDDHPLWVYAIDGRYVEPQLVDVSNRSYLLYKFLTRLVGDDFLTW